MKQRIEENADAILDAIGGLQALQRFKPDPQTGRAEVIIVLKEYPFAKFLLTQGPPGKGLTPALRERLGRAFRDKYVEKLRREHERLVEEIYRLEVNYAIVKGKKQEDVWKTRILKEYFIGLNAIYTEVSPGIIPQIKKLGYVEDVYENRRLEPLLIDSVPLIQADYAHALGYKGGGITVGVLDTGINRFHPDLVNNIWHNPCEIPGDGIDNDGNCLADTNGDGILCGPGDAGVDDDWGWDFAGDDKEPMDEHFHGTHVAGIIAGNGEVIKGVAPEARLISYRVCGFEGCMYDDILSALDMAMVQYGISCTSGTPAVLNMSLGGPGVTCENDPTDYSCDPLVSSVNLASDAGLLVVVAGGNNGDGNYFKLNSSPAVSEKALTAGATDKLDNFATFTAYGPSAHKGQIKPEIVAPGVAICSAWSQDYPPPPDFFESCVDDRHIKLSGTSMATPHVAGASALIMGAVSSLYGETLTVDEVKALLIETGNILSTGGAEASIFKQGGGRLDVKRAVDAGAVITPGALNLGQARFSGTQNFWTTSAPLVVHNYSDQDIIMQLTYKAPNGIAVSIPSSLVVQKKNYGIINAGFTLYSWAPPPVASPEYEGRIIATYILNGQEQTLHVPFAIIPAPIRIAVGNEFCPVLIHIHNRKDLRFDFYHPVPVCVDNQNEYCLSGGLAYSKGQLAFEWFRPGVYDFIIVGVKKIDITASCVTENMDMNGDIYYLVKENHEVFLNKLNLLHLGQANITIDFSLKNHNGDDVFTATKGVSMNLAFLFERANPPEPGPAYPDSATPYGSLYLGPYSVTPERLSKLHFSSISSDYNIDFMFKTSSWELQPDGKVKTTNELIRASMDGLSSSNFYENCTTPDDCAGKFHVTTKFGYRNTEPEGCFETQGDSLYKVYHCHANWYFPFTGRHELFPWAPFVWFLPQPFMSWLGAGEPPNANPSKDNDYTITLYQMSSTGNFAFRDIEFQVWGVDAYVFCFGIGPCGSCVALPIIIIYPYTISPYFSTETIASMKGYLPDLAGPVQTVDNNHPYLMNQEPRFSFVKFDNEPKKIKVVPPLGKYNFLYLNQNGEFDEPAIDTEVYLDGSLVFSEYNVLTSTYWYNPPKEIDLPYDREVKYLMGFHDSSGVMKENIIARFSTRAYQMDKNPPYIYDFDMLSEEGYPAEQLWAGQKRIIRFKVRDDETGLSSVELYWRPDCPGNPNWQPVPWMNIPLTSEGNDTYSGRVPLNIDPTWSVCNLFAPEPDGGQWMTIRADFKINAEDNAEITSNSSTYEISHIVYYLPYNVETFPVNIERDIGGFYASYTFDTATRKWTTSASNGFHICNATTNELRDVIGVYLRDFPYYVPDYDTWVSFLNFMFYTNWTERFTNTISYPTQAYASPPWQEVPFEQYNVQFLFQPDGYITLGNPEHWRWLPQMPPELALYFTQPYVDFANASLLNPAPYIYFGDIGPAIAPDQPNCETARLLEWFTPNMENFVSQMVFVGFLPQYDPLEQGQIPVTVLVPEIDNQGNIVLKQEMR